MSDLNQAADLAHRFFDALEAGDIDTAYALMNPGATVWHNVDGVAMSVEDSYAAQQRFLQSFADIRFNGRRAIPAGEQCALQYDVCCTAPWGAAIVAPACAIVTASGGGIDSLAEYIDPGPFMPK